MNNYSKKKMLPRVFLLIISILLQGCSTSTNIDSSASVSAEDQQSVIDIELSSPDDETLSAEAARIYADPVEAAFHRFTWLGYDNKPDIGAAEMPVGGLFVSVCDLDLNGEKEIMIRTSSDYIRYFPVCQIYQIIDHEMTPVGAFEGTPIEDDDKAADSLRSAEKNYYTKENGEKFMLQWLHNRDYGHMGYYCLMEVSLEDFSSTPVLLWSEPDSTLAWVELDRYGNETAYGAVNQYYVYDKENYSYSLGDIYKVHYREQRADSGWIEITKEEYDHRMEKYLAELQQVGTLKIDDVGRYPTETTPYIYYYENNTLQSTSYEWISINITDTDTAEEIEDKMNHVIADAVYQEYIK